MSVRKFWISFALNTRGGIQFFWFYSNKQTNKQKKHSRNKICIFLIQLIESFNMSQESRRLEHSILHYQKLIKTWTKWFLKKAIWRVKSLLSKFHKKISRKLFSKNKLHMIKIFLREESIAIYAVTQIEYFFSCFEGGTLWLSNICFRGKWWRGNIYFVKKNCLDGFQSKFLQSCNTRFWSSQSDHGKRYFQKLDFSSSPWLLASWFMFCVELVHVLTSFTFGLWLEW